MWIFLSVQRIAWKCETKNNVLFAGHPVQMAVTNINNTHLKYPLTFSLSVPFEITGGGSGLVMATGAGGIGGSEGGAIFGTSTGTFGGTKFRLGTTCAGTLLVGTSTLFNGLLILFAATAAKLLTVVKLDITGEGSRVEGTVLFGVLVIAVEIIQKMWSFFSLIKPIILTGRCRRCI